MNHSNQTQIESLTNFTITQAPNHYHATHKTYNSDKITRSTIPYDDLISKQPRWMVRWGISVIAFICVIFISLAAWLPYSEKIIGKAFLTSADPALDIYPMSMGRIAGFYAYNNDTIQAAQKILLIENAANSDDLELLNDFVDTLLRIQNIRDFLKIAISDKLQTGDLRITYTSMQQNLSSIQFLLKQTITQDRITSLEGEMKTHKSMDQSNRVQLELEKKQLDISIKNHQRNQVLHDQKVISDLDFEKSEAEILLLQQLYEAHLSALMQYQLSDFQLGSQKLQLNAERTQALNQYRVKLTELSIGYKNEYEAWKQKYLITASIAGILYIPDQVHLWDKVAPDKPVLSVIPISNQGHIAQITIPVERKGKIKEGDLCFLRFPSYPYKEYGSIQSSIHSISALPKETQEGKQVYTLLALLPPTLVTDEQKILNYQPRIPAEAIIIPTKRSLLQYVLKSFSPDKY